LASAGEEETRENVDPPVDRSFHRSAFSRPSMKGDAKGVDDASRSRSGRVGSVSERTFTSSQIIIGARKNVRPDPSSLCVIFSPPRWDWLPAENPREVSE